MLSQGASLGPENSGLVGGTGTYAPYGAARSVTTIVAASNSSAHGQASADYVCTGTNDDVTINLAAALGGAVQLLEGDYYEGTNGQITISVTGTTLAGTGPLGGAVIHLPAGYTGTAAVKVTASGSCTLRDFNVTATLWNAGTGYGIWTQCNQPKVMNIEVDNTGGIGIYIDGPGGGAFDGIVQDCEAVHCGASTFPGADGIASSLNATGIMFVNCTVNGGTGGSAGLITTTITAATHTGPFTINTSSGLTGAIASGDTLWLMQPATGNTPTVYQPVVAAAPALAGATSFTVNTFTSSVPFNAFAAVVVDRMNNGTTPVTRYGFNIAGAENYLVSCHAYRCYESSAKYTGAAFALMEILGGEYENSCYSQVSLEAVQVMLTGTAIYGSGAFAALTADNLDNSTITGNSINGMTGMFGLKASNGNACTYSGNSIFNGTSNSAGSWTGEAGSTIAGNTVGYSLSGASQSLVFTNVTHCSVTGNSSTAQPWSISGTNTGSVFEGNAGLNPVGVVSPAVPSSGSPVASQVYARTFYITTGAATTTVAISGGPSITLAPSLAGQAVRVPAGCTLTPTYTNAPTWVVEGE